MNPLLITSEIQRYLDNFPSQSRRRGKRYYADGAVLEVTCIEPDCRFAAVVRGRADYEVSFEYDPEQQSWLEECTCPMGYDCKHAYAAMLALQGQAAALSAPAPVAKGKRSRKPKTKSITLQERPQPPTTALTAALTQALGRKPQDVEADFVRLIQWLYQQARQGQLMTASSLRQLAPMLNDFSWTPLELWPDFPSDDLQFWLYCAWELRRRGLAIPRFIEPVTEFSRIESGMKAFERRKQIEAWRANLGAGATESGQDQEPLDLRLMIFPDEARVQWKREAEGKFKDLKQTQLRHLTTEYEAGTLAVSSEAMALWLALYNPYDAYTASHYTFERPETVKMLGRVLRVPSLVDRVVTPEEIPLTRPAESLQYRLLPARDESEDYQLDLALPDGSTPPVLLALPGHPPLYLTQRAVFQGPPPHRFGNREPLQVPAPALECVEGVNFLQRLRVELPPRIKERTRLVPVKVKLRCQLRPTYQGSNTEAAYLRVQAEFEGGAKEECGREGWYEPANYGRANGHKPKNGNNGIISLLDRSAQRHFPARLEELGARWDDYYSCWRLALNKKFPELFLPWLQALPAEILVELDGELATLRDAPVCGRVELDLEEAGVDWFDLKVALKVTDISLTQDELKLLLNARGGYVRLGKKGWRRLQFDLSPEDDERLARLGLNARDFTAEPQRLHALQLADEAARKFLPEVQAEQIHRRAAELKMRVTPAVPAGISADLRPYQTEGFHFLAYLTANHFGGVLADDMGLGKTLQTLTWLAWLREGSNATSGRQNGEGPVRNGNGSAPLPILVVCPKSVMNNWRTEAQRFCQGLRVRLWQGEEATALERARAEADLIVLNYAQLRALSPHIEQHHWQVAILDEAQYIKNPDSQTAQIARGLQAEHRLALTGTPIENRLLDLWSILAFAMPGVLGNRAHFTRRYNQQDDPFARRRLAARVRPFLLRRTKGQVAQDLPDKVEEDLVCEMEGEQRTLYSAEFKRAQLMLLNIHTQAELNQQRFHFLTSLLRLRQICCHPALVNNTLTKADSAKVNALIDLLEPLMEEGHKVLVFSQFVGMLSILRDTVKRRGWNHFYLAGDTENRGPLVEEFQQSTGAAVFLISLRAGGFGLNLTAASYVVLFDPWWNPAVEMQAIDRTHRIGQVSKVIAYRLLIKDSIEQKIRQLQRTKAALAEDVLGEERFGESLTLEDLRFLFEDEPLSAKPLPAKEPAKGGSTLVT